MMLRIISGRFKRSILEMPPSLKTRPTKDQARESLFNVLKHRFNVFDHSIVVVDAFAGSGSLGFEALSNGAQKCYFIENDSKVLSTLYKNVQKLNLCNEAKIIKGNVFSNHQFHEKIDLIFADPPYGIYETKVILCALKQWASPDSLFVLETDSYFEDHRIKIVEQKKYGICCFTFFYYQDFDISIF
jgi:16S rRNA (guanine966-N2)-methyltransferase